MRLGWMEFFTRKFSGSNKEVQPAPKMVVERPNRRHGALYHSRTSSRPQAAGLTSTRHHIS